MLAPLVLLMLCADVQISSLPAPVRAALSSTFPKAKVVKVEVEEKDRFEVELTSEEGPFEVTFARDGSVLGEERVVPLAAAPAAVRKTIASWTGWTVGRIERVTEGKVVVWEIVARPAKGGPVEIVLNAEGTELKRGPATEE